MCNYPGLRYNSLLSKRLYIVIYCLVSMKGEKRERIIRTLLDDPDGGLTAYRIHNDTGCSQQWIGSYLKKLGSMNLVRGTKVIDPIGLLYHWLSIRKPPRYAEYHLQEDPLGILRNITFPYALTTYQADHLVDRYLFPTRTDIYILEDDLDLWHGSLLSHGLVGPGNTRIIIADPHILDNSFKMDDHFIVPRPQLICDLLMEGGVAVDAANILIGKWYHDPVR